MSNNKILVIDKNHVDAEVVSNILKSKDYFVQTASNEKEAFGQILHDTPDLILIDSKCHEVKNFCQLIKGHSQIPVIVLTEIKRRFDDFRYLEAEAEDFIVRPFATEVLSFTVKSSLKRKSAVAAAVSHVEEYQLAMQLE